MSVHISHYIECWNIQYLYNIPYSLTYILKGIFWQNTPFKMYIQNIFSKDCRFGGRSFTLLEKKLLQKPSKLAHTDFIVWVVGIHHSSVPCIRICTLIARKWRESRDQKLVSYRSLHLHCKNRWNFGKRFKSPYSRGGFIYFNFSSYCIAGMWEKSTFFLLQCKCRY